MPSAHAANPTVLINAIVAAGTPPDQLRVGVADGTAVSFTLITVTVIDANDPGVVTFAATSRFEVGTP